VGSLPEIVLAVATVLMSAAFLSWTAESSLGAIPLRQVERAAGLVLAFAIGGSTLAFGPTSLANLAVLIAGGLIILLFCRLTNGRVQLAAQA